MAHETRICQNCKQSFVIEPEDFVFYEKIKVPPPTWCPECRDQRRWASGNDLTLYRASCDLCHNEMISMYRPDGPFAVYCSACWWSDNWDPTSYGMVYDFSKRFFDQFKELQLRVPRMATSVFGCEGSPYVNNCGNMKNCYMCTSCGYCEDSYYLIWGEHNKSCLDGFKSGRNELCVELVNTNGSYRSAWLMQCESMIDSYFCYDCRQCTKCIFSHNLRNKSLHIFNRPVSEEEYEVFVKTLSSASKVDEYKQTWRLIMQKAIHKYLALKNCVNVVGENVTNSVNSYWVFDSDDLENVRYSSRVLSGTKDSMDISSYGYGCEMSYEAYGLGGGASNCLFTRQCVEGIDHVDYSDLCTNSNDLFGCICLRKKSFCILNKQYSKEEYAALKERIISRMREDGEYGEYFPGSISPFGYNESTAMLYYPLTKEDALALGYGWNDAMPETKGRETMQWAAVPDRIEQVDEAIANEIFSCEKCKRNYKIIKQELRLLKKLGLSLPHHCSLCRHAERIALRNRSRFYHRQCMCENRGHDHAARCLVEFETTYAPDRPEIIYCEECYQTEVV